MPDRSRVIVGLAEAVESLRAELMKAVEAGKGQPMQFSVEPIELTAQVVVTKGADGKIGWDLLGVGGSYESASTQTRVGDGARRAGLPVIGGDEVVKRAVPGTRRPPTPGTPTPPTAWATC